MKQKVWQFCLMLLISPYFLLAQGDVALLADTITSPVTSPFISFQAQVQENKRINIQWEVGTDSAEYFTVERSVDAKAFEAVGILKSVAGMYKYEFADEFPARGQVFYRLRYTAKNGNEFYSEAATVILPGATFFRFYPNPADKLLIVRAEYAIDLLITDGFGKQRISKSLGAGPQVIDVSFLEKGVYIIRITDKSSGRQQFDKFLKN